LCTPHRSPLWRPQHLQWDEAPEQWRRSTHPRLADDDVGGAGVAAFVQHLDMNDVCTGDIFEGVTCCIGAPGCLQ
jgi:hypothetical protein